MKRITREQRILSCLEMNQKPVSISEIAKQLETDLGNVSKGIKLLAKSKKIQISIVNRNNTHTKMISLNKNPGEKNDPNGNLSNGNLPQTNLSDHDSVENEINSDHTNGNLIEESESNNGNLLLNSNLSDGNLPKPNSQIPNDILIKLKLMCKSEASKWKNTKINTYPSRLADIQQIVDYFHLELVQLPKQITGLE